MPDLNKTPDGFKEIINKHLKYDIEMLGFTYYSLAAPPSNKGMTNALIESFCIHARNLLDFFEEDKPITGRDTVARHFADASYNPFPNGAIDGRLYGKLNSQIAHLSYQRTDNDSDKIGAADRNTIMELIRNEVANFKLHLKDRYKPAWNPVADKWLQPAADDHLVLRNLPVQNNTTSSEIVIVGPSNITGPTGPVGPTGPLGPTRGIL